MDSQVDCLKQNSYESKSLVVLFRKASPEEP